MTRAEIHEALREGWMETDAYRAYGHYLGEQRARALQDRPTGRRRLEHGTPEFRAAAQRWWIGVKLRDMRGNGSVRREGFGDAALWFAGRAPRIRGQKSTYVPFDPAESRTVLTSTTAEHVNRENAKAALLKLLNDKRIKGKARELAQEAYDYLCGRR